MLDEIDTFFLKKGNYGDISEVSRKEICIYHTAMGKNHQQGWNRKQYIENAHTTSMDNRLLYTLANDSANQLE